MSEKHFAYFIEALETLENLLHAETQAIAAHELDTIDEIMQQKDISLETLLAAKDSLEKDPRNNQLANEKLDYVMNLQSRNAISLKKLKDRVEAKNKADDPSRKSSENKARSTYLEN